MANQPRQDRDLGACERLVVGQLSVATILVDRLLRTRPDRAARWLQRASGASWLRCFPLLHRRVPLARHAALCARAARRVQPDRRGLVQSMLFLWMVRARGHGASLVTGIEAFQAARVRTRPS